MINGYFDIVQFMQALDQAREARGLTWFGVFQETGIQWKSWTQYKRGQRAMSVHTMATLALWGNLNVADYIKQEVPV